VGLLIKHGELIDPEGKHSGKADVLIEGGKIAKIGTGIRANGHETLDAAGLWGVPRFIDMHVHLRDPGV